MPRYKLTDEVPFRVQLSWLNMSFTAGAINAGGFMACRQFVSHVTGFVTISGVNVVHYSWREALGALSIPGFFTVGVMLSAFLTERAKTEDGIAKKFEPAMALVALILLAVIVLGQAGFFGEFGVADTILSDYMLIALLCMACGIQNAAVTSATAASIRPTHLTGITTDLGIGIVRTLLYARANSDWRRELRVNWTRVELIGTFILGTIVGTIICSMYGYLGFALPLVTSTFAVYENRRQRKRG